MIIRKQPIDDQKRKQKVKLSETDQGESEGLFLILRELSLIELRVIRTVRFGHFESVLQHDDFVSDERRWKDGRKGLTSVE